MENNFGQLIVYLENINKQPDFKTTRSFWCTKEGALTKISKLQIEGNEIKVAYFNDKKLNRYETSLER